MEEQIRDYLRFLQTHQDYAPNTIQAYRSDLTQLLNFAVNEQPYLTRWGRVDKPLLLLFLAHLKQREYTAASIARKIAVIKTFYQFLARRNLIPSNPAPTLAAPRVEKQVPHVLKPEEIERLLTLPAGYSTPKAFRDRAILELLYTSGMRVSELVVLDAGDVDLQSRTIQCARRAATSRVVRIDPRAADALANYLRNGRPTLAAANEPALFVNPQGERLTRQGLRRVVREYVKGAGITATVTPNTLRHSFAVHQLSRGEELSTVQRRLGHADKASTQVYLRLVKESEAALTEPFGLPAA